MRLNLQLFAKSNEELAKEVIRGNWGNGADRKNRLTAAGYNYSDVQAAVNSMLGGSSSTTKPTTPTTPVPTTPATPTTPKGSEIADKTRQELLSSKPGDFTYDPYQFNWQPHLNDIIDKIFNREKFTYDLNGDALYQQYKDQYMTQGKLASMDVMGQAAAMNGGYGSSYGQTVGHQAYQDYLQQLNDKVPELYQLALDQYNREGQELYNQYGLLADMDDRDYTRYMDDVKMKYGIHRDSVTDWHNDLNRADSEYWNMVEQEYRTERNAIADAETKKKYAYDTAMGMLSMGVTPSAQMLADAGISSEDANDIVKKVTEQTKASADSSSENKSLSLKDSGAIMSKLQAYQDNEDNPGLEKYLNGLVATGTISPGQYEALYEQYYTDPKYTYEETEAVKNFTSKIRSQHEFARGTNPDNTKYKTYKDYVRGMLEKYKKDLTDNDIATISKIYGLY